MILNQIYNAHVKIIGKKKTEQNFAHLCYPWTSRLSGGWSLGYRSPFVKYRSNDTPHTLTQSYLMSATAKASPASFHPFILRWNIINIYISLGSQKTEYWYLTSYFIRRWGRRWFVAQTIKDRTKRNQEYIYIHKTKPNESNKLGKQKCVHHIINGSLLIKKHHIKYQNIDKKKKKVCETNGRNKGDEMLLRQTATIVTK